MATPGKRFFLTKLKTMVIVQCVMLCFFYIYNLKVKKKKGSTIVSRKQKCSLDNDIVSIKQDAWTIDITYIFRTAVWKVWASLKIR